MNTTPAKKRVLPPAVLAVALIVMVALHFAWPGTQLLRYPLTLIGLLPLATGIALNLSVDRAFKVHRTTIKPFERPSFLVTSGAFRLSRNPIYLGMVLLLLGVALLLGTLTPLAVVPVFALWIDRGVIRFEERMLAETFGDAWRSYRRRVRRWI